MKASRKGRYVRAASAGVCVWLLAGCSSPLGRDRNLDTLQRSVRMAAERELTEARKNPSVRDPTTQLASVQTPIPPELLPTLEKMAGPQSYTVEDLVLGRDHQGEPMRTVGVTLERAARTAAANNLSIQFGRLEPAIAESRVVQAQAAFDWVFFSTLDISQIDSPTTVQAVQGVQFGVGADVRDVVDWSGGLRRQTTTGGAFSISQQLVYTDVRSPGLDLFPDPSGRAVLSIQYDQPLLRNFGSDVALQQVRLNRNAERSSIAQLKADLIQTVTDVERAYWNLYQAYFDLLILQRLLDRAIEVRDILEVRRGLDVSDVEFFDAAQRVESRRTLVIRARNALRASSDQLKLLMNDPDLPVGAESLLLPLDGPLKEPIEFSLVDSLGEAFAMRPEVQQAILSIDDASIRQTVADNARLPQLDARVQVRLNQLDEDVVQAAENEFNSGFTDFVFGLVFEQAIGNRGAEALSRERSLQRLQATVAYRDTLQQISADVQRSINDLITNYTLIDQTRVSRLAATQSLNAFEVQYQNIGDFGPNTMNLLLNRQEQLANAERDEVGALVDYNITLAEFAAAKGTALERNRIDFEVPSASEVLANTRPVASSE